MLNSNHLNVSNNSHDGWSVRNNICVQCKSLSICHIPLSKTIRKPLFPLALRINTKLLLYFTVTLECKFHAIFQRSSLWNCRCHDRRKRICTSGSIKLGQLLSFLDNWPTCYCVATNHTDDKKCINKILRALVENKIGHKKNFFKRPNENVNDDRRR